VTVSCAVGGQDCWPQTDTRTAGQVVDVLPGSPLEAALGANIVPLTDPLLTNAITGSDGQATANA